MSASKDPRRQVGAIVHARATAVTSTASCARLFGSLFKDKTVNGIVKDVIVDRSKARASTSLKVEWLLTTNPTITKTVKTVKLVNVKLGHDKSGSQNVSNVQELLTGEEMVAEENDKAALSLDVERLVNQQSWDQWDEEMNHANNGKNSVNVHDVSWTEEQVRAPVGGHVPRRFWKVRSFDGETIREGGGIGNRSPYDCFMAMFPFNHLVQIKKLTHERLLQHGKKGTSVSEVLRFFGILMLMTRFEFGNKLDLWSTEPSRKYIPAPCFGKTGMVRDRFVDILKHVRFSRQPDSQGDLTSVQWRWALVQDFVDAINNHREQSVTPSEILCVDESISRWYGRGGHWIDIGLPHYVAIDRKPENGCEIQDTCCGRSGILLRLELVTTAEEESLKDSNADVPHGAVVLERLVNAWSGSGRIVCADSYFASVTAAERLLEMDLNFIGVIKTATKKYPMTFLSSRELSSRDQSVCMVNKSQDGSVKLMALMWTDKNRRYFISTTSHAEDGAVYHRIRWRQTEEGPKRVKLTVPQPKVCEIYYSACAQVDMHNRCRQDDLNLEKKIGTKEWSFRVNCSLLSMVIVDSWLLYSGAQGNRYHLGQRQFYETLATQLIDNAFEGHDLRYSGSFNDTARCQVVQSSPASGIGIHLTPTRERRKSKDGKVTSFAMQRKCRICKNNKTTHLCSACMACGGTTVWLCRGSCGRSCFLEHLKNVHNINGEASGL